MPPATVTSPEQENVLGLLNLRPAAEQPNPFSLPSVTVAMMHGLANLKSNKMATDAANEAVDTPPPQTTVSSRVDPATGKTVHDITHRNVVLGNAQEGAQAAYDLPQMDLARELAPYAKQFGHEDPTGSDIANKLNSFWGRYQLQHELGGPEGEGNSSLRAFINAAITDENPKLERSVRQHRLEQAIQDYKTVQPIVQEATTARERNIQNARLERLVGKENADVISKVPFYANEDPAKDLELGAQAIGKSPDDLTAREKSAITNSATISRTTFEKTRAKTAAEAIDKSGLHDVSGVQSPDDIADLVKTKAATIPGGMKPDEQALLANRLGGLYKEYQKLDVRQQQQITNERIRAEAERKNVELLDRQIQAGSPAAVASAADLIEKNPDYAEHIKDNVKNPDFLENVSRELDRRGVNLPHKPPQQDQERLTTITTGRNLLDQMDRVASDVKAQTGRDLTGPIVGLATAADNKIGTPTVSQAALSGLNKQQRAYFIKAANQYNSLAGQLLLQEAKNASGRLPVQVLDLLHQTTPALFKGGAINAGSTAGIRDAFDAAEHAIQTSRYGGRPPKGAPGGNAGAAPIVQKNKATGAFRYSTDGGKTWQPGRP